MVQISMISRKEKPTNREVKIFCRQCNSKDKIFMTNVEIFNKNTSIHQPCKKCKKWTWWGVDNR